MEVMMEAAGGPAGARGAHPPVDLLRHALPKWWSTKHGEETLAGAHETLRALLDPDGYHSTVAALQSTTEAVTQSLSRAARRTNGKQSSRQGDLGANARPRRYASRLSV